MHLGIELRTGKNMRSTLITNIGELTTNDHGLRPEHDDVLRHAALVCEGEQIVWVGDASETPSADECIDAEGRAVLPGWVDSHTHMVFAGDRTAEFAARMAGESYAASGIWSTVSATRQASDAVLAENLARLIAEARRGGTTTLETKTGYGLTIADEVRSARIAAAQADTVTFLGAHVVPSEEEAETYLQLVTGAMLDAVTPHISAVDVFCEQGAFDESATAEVLRAAAQRGLPTHVHGNQLGYGPGVQLAVAHQALSVDHLGFLSDADIAALADSWSTWGSVRDAAGRPAGQRGTVATVLPACDLSTRTPLAPARALLDAGVTVAIASNCNPGTSYTSAMGFCVAIAVLQMGLSVPEAVRAATLGGAIALGMHEDGWRDPHGNPQPRVGMIAPGARADLHMLDAPSSTHLAYRPGMPLTRAVWRKGQLLPRN